MADIAVPSVAPSSATAGDTIAWRIACPDTPYGDGWTVTVVLAGLETASATAVVDPDDADACRVTFAPAATSGLSAGVYRWTALATRGAGSTLERLTIDRGSLVLAPDPAALVGDEGLSTDERELRTVDALIAQIQANPNASYTIDGASGTRHDLPSLYARQGVLRMRVARSRAASTGARGIGRNVAVTLRRG